MSFKPRTDLPPIMINIPNRASPPGASRRDAGRAGASFQPDPFQRRVIGWLVALTTAGVLFCGLFPFDFVFHFATAGDEFRRRFDWTIDQLYTAGDGLENIVFFTPTGFALAALFLRNRRNDWKNIAIAAALVVPCGAVLSAFVECSQVYLQSRDPSLADICSNTTGTTVGFVLFILIGSTVLNAVVAALRKLDRWLTPRRSLAAAILWLLIAILAPLFSRDAGSISDWNPAYPLLLGNETTGDRWWNGQVNSVWIADRAVDDAEMDRVVAGGDVGPLLGHSLVANYSIAGRGPFTNTTGGSDALHWRADSPDKLSDRASAVERYRESRIAFSASEPSEYFPPILMATSAPGAQPLGKSPDALWWLQTAGGGFSAPTKKISVSQAFTIVVDLQTDDLDQHDGPPRILSMSLGTMACNLQLLQESSDLIIRLRTVASGDGGSDPEFILPYIFIDPAPRRIVVSFDHGQLLATTDHVADRDRFRFTPESNLIWKIYPRPGWAFRLDSNGQNVCANIYRVLALFPIGCLLMRSQAGAVTLRKSFASVVIAALLVQIALWFETGHFPAVSTLPTALASGIAGIIIAGWQNSTIVQLRKQTRLW